MKIRIEMEDGSAVLVNEPSEIIIRTKGEGEYHADAHKVTEIVIMYPVKIKTGRTSP